MGTRSAKAPRGHGAAGRGASRRAARSRGGTAVPRPPVEAAPQLQPPPRPSLRRETEAAGGRPAGGVLTWQNAAPALGPGRAAGPSRASRRGEGRLWAWGERRRRRDPPDTRCAALQPRRLPPGSAPPGRQGKVGHLFCESAAGGGGAPRRVLAPREGPPPAPRGPGGSREGSSESPRHTAVGTAPREPAAAAGTGLVLPLCGTGGGEILTLLLLVHRDFFFICFRVLFYFWSGAPS